MPVSTNEPDPATLASLEATAALGVGDTALARKKHAEAGAILERDMKAHRGGEKHLLRFLAATQYYKGGEYEKAQELAKKIDAGALPKNVRGLLPQFLKEVKLRAVPGYAMRMRRSLHSLWSQQKIHEGLRLLQDHPFIFDAAGLAFMRALLCERIGDYQAAALFFSSVIRFAPQVTDATLMSATYPLVLTTRGQVEEAWKYIQHQLEVLPHPITYVTAAIVCYRRSVATNSQERKKWLENLTAFLEKSRDAYQKLPAEQQNHPDIREYMAFGFETAALTWLLLGNKERSKEVWHHAVKLGANPNIPWAVRAFATSSSEPVDSATEAKYLSEREEHFSTQFAREKAIWQQLEMVAV